MKVHQDDQLKKRLNNEKQLIQQSDGTIVEQLISEGGDEEGDDGQTGDDDDDDDEYEERIVNIQPKLIENWTKPSDARDIPTWPIINEETSKTVQEKKRRIIYSKIKKNI